MKISLMQLTEQDLISNANTVKEVIIAGLVKEGYLTEEQSAEIKSCYIVTLAKRGLLGSVIDKLLKLDEKKDFYYILTKIV